MKLFRKAIRQRRLTRMRELLTAVMMQNNSENQFPEDGRTKRGIALAIEIIAIISLIPNLDVFESSGAFLLMGLFFPPFLLFGILTRNGYYTPHYRDYLFISLFQSRFLLSRVWEVNGTRRRRAFCIQTRAADSNE